MGARRVVTVEVVRRDWILDIFWKQNRQDLLMDWIWRRGKERSRERLQNFWPGETERMQLISLEDGEEGGGVGLKKRSEA